MHPAKASVLARSVSIKLPAEAEEKYFSGLKAKDRMALEAWFGEKGVTAHV